MTRSDLPYWPLGVMLWGLPAWWLLGLMQLAPIGLAILMAGFLLIRAEVRVRPAIAWYGLFVGWTVCCAAMIDSPERMIGYGLRLAGLVTVGIVMVYVDNLPGRVVRAKVPAALTAVWCYVLAGGYLALIAPSGGFTTLAGRLLPAGLRSNGYVHDLFFPTFAEIQHPWGSPTAFARPAAPFPYTNGWGAAVVLLTPAVLAVLLRTTARRRVWLLLALAAMAVPAAATSNRGMFLGLAVAIGYVGARMVAAGRLGTALGIAAAVLAGAVLLVTRGALGQISERQEYGRSTDTRAALYDETLRRVLDSPVFGYGAPRPSIENGISVGTQGYVWMVVFSYGFVGLLLFAAFLCSALWTTRRAAGVTGICLRAGLVAATVVIWYYGLDTTQWLVLGSCVATLLQLVPDRAVAVAVPVLAR